VSEPHDEAESRPDLGAEIGRLVAAVQEWARRAIPDSAIGHGGPECQWCPICQFVNVVRGEHPEVADRLAEAGSSLAAALKAVTEAAVARTQGEQRGRPKPGPRVERIDLGDPRES
jgi:hypothetical protein